MANVTWTGTRIRMLRSRLGWSRSDLARRLSCESSLIERWEEETSAPDFQMTRLLELFENHAEINSLTTRQEPLADRVLGAKNLEQVRHSDLFKN